MPGIAIDAGMSCRNKQQGEQILWLMVAIQTI
jgi:hypothetical protein